jgi:hypothetical protein
MGKLKEAFTEVNDIWSYLEDNEMFTFDELRLITDINGYNIDTLNDALYSRYGYRSLEQYLEEQL